MSLLFKIVLVFVPTQALAQDGAAQHEGSNDGAGPTPIASTPSKPAVSDRYSSARTLFEHGVTAALGHAWDQAARLFEESAALVPRPSTLFNLALAQIELARSLQAERTLRRYLAVAKASGSADEARLVQAQRLRAELIGQLATLSVRVSPDDAQVSLDGMPFHLLDDMGAALVEPGEHQLEARAANYHSVLRSVSLLAGQTQQVSLVLRPVGDRPDGLPPSAAGLDAGVHSSEGGSDFWRSPWLWVGVASALAGGLLAAVLLNRVGGSESEPYGGSADLRL